MLASQEANIMNAESGRAWISIVEITLLNTLQVSSGIALRISFQNVGKDPASKTRSRVSIQLFPAHEVGDIVTWSNPDVNNCILGSEFTEGHVIFPSGIMGARSETVSLKFDKIPFWHNGQIYQIPASVDMAKEMVVCSYIVFINVCMVYNSAGKRHYTRFCDYLDPVIDKPLDQWAIKECPNGNEAD